jgi:hypothetical protein
MQLNANALRNADVMPSSMRATSHCSVASKSRHDAWRMERDSFAQSFDQASHLNMRPEQSCLAYIIRVLDARGFQRGLGQQCFLRNISVYRPPWRAPFLYSQSFSPSNNERRSLALTYIVPPSGNWRCHS